MSVTVIKPRRHNSHHPDVLRASDFSLLFAGLHKGPASRPSHNDRIFAIWAPVLPRFTAANMRVYNLFWHTSLLRVDRKCTYFVFRIISRFHHLSLLTFGDTSYIFGSHHLICNYMCVLKKHWYSAEEDGRGRVDFVTAECLARQPAVMSSGMGALRVPCGGENNRQPIPSLSPLPPPSLPPSFPLPLPSTLYTINIISVVWIMCTLGVVRPSVDLPQEPSLQKRLQKFASRALQ